MGVGEGRRCFLFESCFVMFLSCVVDLVVEGVCLGDFSRCVCRVDFVFVEGGRCWERGVFFFFAPSTRVLVSAWREVLGEFTVTTKVPV